MLNFVSSNSPKYNEILTANFLSRRDRAAYRRYRHRKKKRSPEKKSDRTLKKRAIAFLKRAIAHIKSDRTNEKRSPV
jgi:hypothetical protein